MDLLFLLLWVDIIYDKHYYVEQEAPNAIIIDANRNWDTYLW